MASMLNPQTCGAYAERLGRISEQTPRRFGKMSAAELMAHLRRTFEISMGEQEAPFVGNWLTRTRLMKWFVIDSPMPWPKGRIKAPKSFSPEPEGDLEAERQRALEAMERFVERAATAGPDAMGGQSPLLGRMPWRRWSKLHARHVEHHCQQFGV